MADAPLELLHITIKSHVERELLLRAGRAMEYLVDAIKQAYREVLKVQSGESGALGGLVGEMRTARDLIAITVGVTKAAQYLANIDLGERGTKGGPTDAPFVRKKAPPVASLYRWLVKGQIEIPAYYRTRAERNAKRKTKSDKPWLSEDPGVLYAFDIAMKRKRYGRVGLKLIEKTVRAKADKIRSYLEGA